jgi:hypothetical protein
MPALPGAPFFDEISRKWLDFAERREKYFDELFRNGRWQHYYTMESFARRMHDVNKAVAVWKKLAGQTAGKNDLAA